MSRTSPCKRARRHATGASNVDVENVRATLTKPPPPFPLPALPLLPAGLQPRPDAERSGLPTIDHKRAFSPGDVNLLQSSRVVSVPKQSRDNASLSEQRTADRPLANRVHDKMWMTGRLGFIRKVLHSYDKDHSGQLSTEQLKGVMDRINLGLNDEEKERVIARLDPSGEGVVSTEKFLVEFDVLKPLGDTMSEEKLRASGLQNNVQTLQPWESRRGSMHAWRRPERQVMGISNAAEAGSFEQQKEDLFLMSLVRGKLNQHKDKLRLMFRQMDGNRNSLIDRQEFVNALQSLKMQIAKPQLERLFDLADRDNSGSIDYNEFIRVVESTDVLTQKLKQAKRDPGQRTLAEQLNIGPDDVAAVLRNPLVYELSRRLYTKASNAHAVFKQFDINGDGYLSVDELSSACGALVPGIQKRDVAAMMVKIDKSGDGYLDFKEFIKSMVEAGASNPRMVDAELRREDDPPLMRSSWAHSPIWDRPVTPRSCAASWSLPSQSTGQKRSQEAGSTWDEEAAVHEAAVAPVIESLESGLRAWTLMEPRLTTSAGDGASGRGQEGPDDVVSVAAPLSQSLDLSSLYRARGGTTVSGRVPSHGGSRFNRHWHLKHPDTRHITSAVENSSQYLATEQMYMRKSDPQFMKYQDDDVQRRLRHHERARQVKQETDQHITAACCAADHRSDEQDRARLDLKGQAKQRYEERAVMYEEARRVGQQGGSLFGRLNLFHEQDNAPALRTGE